MAYCAAMRIVIIAAVVSALVAAQSDSPSMVAERVMKLTRGSTWTLVSSTPIAFRTFHPQGMVKIGETIFVSSVEVFNREAAMGVGHLFKIDTAGALVADLKLGEGA